MSEKQQIAVGSRGVQLTNIEAAYRFSQAVVKSGLAPASFKTPEAVMIAIQYGSELGLAPMQSLQSIAVINGRPSVWGDGLVAIVRGSGDCEYICEWIEGEGDNRTAFCETKRKGEPEPVVGKFSVTDAKTANLWGKRGPWQDYPERMLAARARAFVLRDVYADHLRGIGVREEMLDYAQPLPESEPVPVPVRKLSDLTAPVAVPDGPVAEPGHKPSVSATSAAYASLLADAEAITDANSDEAGSLLNDIAAEQDAGSITADEAATLRGIVNNAIPFG